MSSTLSYVNSVYQNYCVVFEFVCVLLQEEFVALEKVLTFTRSHALVSLDQLGSHFNYSNTSRSFCYDFRSCQGIFRLRN